MLKIKDLGMLQLSVLKPSHKQLELPWYCRRPCPTCPIIHCPGFLPIVGYVHIVFATSFELLSPDIVSVRRSSCPIIRSLGFVPIVANVPWQRVWKVLRVELRWYHLHPLIQYPFFDMICRVFATDWGWKACSVRHTRQVSVSRDQRFVEAPPRGT